MVSETRADRWQLVMSHKLNNKKMSAFSHVGAAALRA